MYDISGNRQDPWLHDDPPDLRSLASRAVSSNGSRADQEAVLSLVAVLTSVSSGLSLDDKLARIMAVAKEITGAHEAVLELVDGPTHRGPPRKRGWEVLEADVRAQEEVIGHLRLVGKTTRAAGFTELDREIAQALAAASGVLIENARLRDQVRLHSRTSRAQGTDLDVEHLGEADQWSSLEDRNRIARDLHDLVIQRLFALGLDVEAISWLRDPEEIARRLARDSAEIDTTIRDIRRIIFRLGATGDDTDPRAAVEELVDRATRTMKLRPRLEFRGPVRTVIDPALLSDVLAVLSEGLSNAARHAQATTCSVELSALDDVVVTIADDGTGLPRVMEESGLANIRARAQQRGGALEIKSVAEVGTTLVWRVPFPELRRAP